MSSNKIRPEQKKKRLCRNFIFLTSLRDTSLVLEEELNDVAFKYFDIRSSFYIYSKRIYSHSIVAGGLELMS